MPRLRSALVGSHLNHALNFAVFVICFLCVQEMDCDQNLPFCFQFSEVAIELKANHIFKNTLTFKAYLTIISALFLKTSSVAGFNTISREEKRRHF